MLSIGILAVIVFCVGGIVWWRRRWSAYAPPVAPGTIPPATLALHAFARGNSCLAEGKFAEAIDAFEQARELDPKQPHVANRLAEVARLQQAASAAPPVDTTV